MFQKKICGTFHVMANNRELKLKEAYYNTNINQIIYLEVRGMVCYGAGLIQRNQLNFSLILWGLFFCVCCSYLQAGGNMAGRVPHLTFIYHDNTG